MTNTIQNINYTQPMSVKEIHEKSEGTLLNRKISTIHLGISVGKSMIVSALIIALSLITFGLLLSPISYQSHKFVYFWKVIGETAGGVGGWIGLVGFTSILASQWQLRKKRSPEDIKQVITEEIENLQQLQQALDLKEKKKEEELKKELKAAQEFQGKLNETNNK